MYLIGGIVAFPCLFGAAYMKNFTGFAILYCIGFPFNHGMTYMAPVHHGWLWFPKNPGLVSGLILSGFGAGALIFDNVLTHIINPDNESIGDDGYYSKAVDDRFRKTFLVLVTSWLIIAIVGCMLTFPGPLPKKRRTGSVLISPSAQVQEEENLNNNKHNPVNDSVITSPNVSGQD